MKFLDAGLFAAPITRAYNLLLWHESLKPNYYYGSWAHRFVMFRRWAHV